MAIKAPSFEGRSSRLDFNLLKKTLLEGRSFISDDAYLLQFLRVRKYSMNEVYQTFERACYVKKRYPQFFDINDNDFKKMMKLFETGFCYPLSERDDDGKRIVLMQTRRLNPDHNSIHDAAKLFFFISAVLLEEEETQIAGFTYIFDHGNITLRHVMSPVDVRDFIDFVKKCATSRQKELYVMNLPSFANVMIELFKAAMTEKLRKRLFILKSPIELKKFVQPSLLPRELGGTRTEAEMMQDFMKLKEQKEARVIEILEKINNIQWDKISTEQFGSEDDGIVGSFRKLEID